MAGKALYLLVGVQFRLIGVGVDVMNKCYSAHPLYREFRGFLAL